MARLTLTLFGAPQVALDGKPLTFAYQKVAALLIYLAVDAHRPHTRTALAALLWPDVPERLARQNLSQALTTLRSLLGDRTARDQPPFLLGNADTIQLNPAADWTLDVRQFVLLVDETRAHAHRALRTCVVCAERLEQLVAIARDHFLDQFSLRDSTPFEEWATIQGGQLRQSALHGLEKLADIAEWHEQYGQAIDYARRQIALEPLRESSHRTLMRLLALSGQNVAALVHYEQVCHAWSRELGVSPEDATVALHDAIVAAADAPAGLRRYRPPIAHVPARPTPLIGRDADLQRVRRFMVHDAKQLITIIGPPGIGKTSLAQTVTSSARFDFVDGVAFVELAPLADATLVPLAIAQTLDIAGRSGEDLTATLMAVLGERHMLLTLDNFEHVPDAASTVMSLLAACPALTVLVTSRTLLGLTGECPYPLEPLTLPAPDAQATAIAQATAVQMFVERAQAARPDFILTAENAAAVAAVCARLDGLPLAIELIAVQTELFTPDELLHQLESHHTTLVDSPPDLPERQRTLHNAISWSFNLLDAREQSVFAQLGVFAGGCTAEALSEIVGDRQTARDILPRLQHASLVRLQAGHGRQRYLVLETIRAYAQEILETTQAITAARNRHAVYYAQLVGDVRNSVSQLLPEYENLLAAAAWSMEQNMSAPALQAGIGLARIWVRNRSWISGLVWLETKAARGTERDPHPPSPIPYPHLQLWAEQQLAHAEHSGDAELRRLARLSLAFVRQAQGRYGEAQQQFEAAVSGQTTVADRFPLVVLAELYARTQQFEQAYTLYTECVGLNRAAGDAEGTADALVGLARIACLRRALNEAAAFGQEALQIYEAVGHLHGVAHVLCIMGSISYESGDSMLAVAQCCRSFAISYQLHDSAGCADLFEALAPILVELGCAELALRVISAASALRSADGTHLTPAEQRRLDTVLDWCAEELGRPAYNQFWQAGQRVGGDQLLALIEDVRLCTPVRHQLAVT